jgi:hypothetical protein
MPITASKLRENVYALLDEVIATGQPLEIERNGRRLRIVVDEPPSKLSRLVQHPEAVVGDPGDLVELEWSSEWRP